MAKERDGGRGDQGVERGGRVVHSFISPTCTHTHKTHIYYHSLTRTRLTLSHSFTHPQEHHTYAYTHYTGLRKPGQEERV